MGIGIGLISPDSGAWLVEEEDGRVLEYRAHLRGCGMKVVRTVPLPEYPGKDWAWDVWLDAKPIGSGREATASLARAAALNSAHRHIAGLGAGGL